LLDLIASYLVRGLNLFLHVMPMWFDLWLGRQVGRLVYLLSGKRSRVTYSNLKAAFYREKDPRWLRRTTKGVYVNLGQTFAELLAMTKVDKKYIDKYIHVEDFQRMQDAARNPNGMILISAHFGNWELSTVASVVKGFPLYLLARDQKMKRLSELLNLLRESKGNFVVRKGMDVKNIFRLLRGGKSVGMLADQNAGSSGELIDLFGRPASTAVGPYRLAQKTGASILPAFIHRTNGPYQRVILEEPMIISKGDDVLPAMHRYNRLLEKHVKDFPEQWFWMHKRWKMTPLKKIIVLDDGRKGHLKQSLAAVEQIKRYRKDGGFSADDIQAEIVRVRFRSRIAKVFLNTVSPFVTDHFQMHLACLRLTLDTSSYDNIVNRYADVIVSCGSTLAGINRLLKVENFCRNLTILDPGAALRRKFNVIIIPSHDASGKLSEMDNVVVTELAPNLIDPSEFKAIDERATGGGGEHIKTLGILVGGDNKHYVFSHSLTTALIRALETMRRQGNVKMNVTTSRRTPEHVEAALSQVLSGDDEFISGRNDTDEHTVKKILSQADIVIVSGESISMVSEAVSSGKQVIVFMPEKRTSRSTKYEDFVKNLEKKGFLRSARAEDIPLVVKDITQGRVKNVLPDDNARIREKLYRLF